MKYPLNNFQLQFTGEVGRWLEDMWAWMVKFKDVVYSLASEVGFGFGRNKA